MTDPVDRALESLRSDRWTGSSRHPRVEAAIVDAAGRQARSSRGLVIGVVGVLIATTLVAASMSGAVGRLFVHVSGTSDEQRPSERQQHAPPDDEFNGAVETAAD